jgi:hypothetical protein
MSETTPSFFTSDEYLPGTDVLIFSNKGKFIENHLKILLSIGFVPITATTLEAAVALLRMTVIELAIVDEETGSRKLRAFWDGSGRRGKAFRFWLLARDQTTCCGARRWNWEL